MPDKLKVLDVGGGHESRASLFYPGAEITTLDKETGWIWPENDLPGGKWDIIFCNHFIEHIINPDEFLNECKRVMQSNTILEVGMPNLIAWFNRIAFLFGYLPHSYEVSYFYNVGKWLNWNEETLGKHVRVMSYKATMELLNKHGFRIIWSRGEASTYPCAWPIRIFDKAMTRLSPNLASAFRIKCVL